jgi:hypothetical protein
MLATPSQAERTSRRPSFEMAGVPELRSSATVRSPHLESLLRVEHDDPGSS